MTGWRLYLMLAILLAFSVLATASAVRTNNYIRETLPRDQAQEQCNTETIEVLKKWLQLRALRDSSMDTRDDAAVVADVASEKADEIADEIILNRLIHGGTTTQEELQRWRDAIAARRNAIAARRDATAADHRIRIEANKQRIFLPAC